MTFRGGSSQKTDIEGGGCLKRGLEQFLDLKGEGLGKKEEDGVLEVEGVDTPMHTIKSYLFLVVPQMSVLNLKTICFGQNI